MSTLDDRIDDAIDRGEVAICEGPYCTNLIDPDDTFCCLACHANVVLRSLRSGELTCALCALNERSPSALAAHDALNHEPGLVDGYEGNIYVSDFSRYYLHHEVDPGMRSMLWFKCVGCQREVTMVDCQANEALAFADRLYAHERDCLREGRRHD